MLLLADVWRSTVPHIRQDMAETMDSNSLNVGICAYRILREKAPVWIVVTVEVDAAHAEGAKNAKAFDSLGAYPTVVRREAFEKDRLREMVESPRYELMRVGMILGQSAASKA